MRSSWPCSSAARARVLVTRVDLVIAAAVDFPGAEHDERARLLTWRTAAAGDFTVAVVTAGTSDGPAADETAAIARAIGLRVQEIRDALLRALVCQYGPPSAVTIRAHGYGAGTGDNPEGANVLPAVLGEAIGPHPDAQLLTIIETTVDDVTGEVLGAVIGYLLADGALDAWDAPVVGKTGRRAHVITALCASDIAGLIEQRLLRETGSLGARHHSVVRHALARQFTEVQVCGHPVRIKIGPHRSKPEHDDVLAVARATGLPIRSVAEQALAEYGRSHQRPGRARSPPRSVIPSQPAVAIGFR